MEERELSLQSFNGGYLSIEMSTNWSWSCLLCFLDNWELKIFRNRGKFWAIWDIFWNLSFLNYQDRLGVNFWCLLQISARYITPSENPKHVSLLNSRINWVESSTFFSFNFRKVIFPQFLIFSWIRFESSDKVRQMMALQSISSELLVGVILK